MHRGFGGSVDLASELTPPGEGFHVTTQAGSRGADPRPKISFRVTTKPPNEPIGTVSHSYDRKTGAGKRPRHAVNRLNSAGYRPPGRNMNGSIADARWICFDLGQPAQIKSLSRICALTAAFPLPIL